MSAIDPTCLPWQTVHDFGIEGQTTIIGNVDGDVIDGTTHHTFDFVARTLDEDDDSQSHSAAVANAEFIVRACNSHAALVSAATQALSIIRLERAIYFDCHTVGSDPATLDSEEVAQIVQYDDAIDALAIAIAKAKGGAA